MHELTSASRFSFAPSADRAAALDEEMRQNLGRSLAYLSAQIDGTIAYDPEALAQFLNRLSRGPISPLAFALYGRTVLLIETRQFGEAEKTMARLVRQPECLDGLHVSDFGDPATDCNAQLVAHFLDNDPAFPLKLVPPRPEASARLRAAVGETFALLDQVDPAFAAEIRALVREVILCSDTHEPGRLTFEGASSLFLWGAVLVNTKRDIHPVHVAQTLAHESAHNLLFGLCPDEPLLLNDPTEKFGSPLRPDLRPLDGIYHATFVLARIYRILMQLAQSGALNVADEKLARQEMRQAHALFQDGSRTLELHAKLTPPGAEILAAARGFMAENKPA